MKWTKKTTFPYFVGEYTQAVTLFEDGKDEYIFTITGVSNTNYSQLWEYANKIKKHLDKQTRILDDGTAVAIFHNQTQPVPTQGLYRIQINLTIKEWSA